MRGHVANRWTTLLIVASLTTASTCVLVRAQDRHSLVLIEEIPLVPEGLLHCAQA